MVILKNSKEGSENKVEFTKKKSKMQREKTEKK